MSLEQTINYQLNKYPGVKKVVKSIYQHVMYMLSPKIKSEGNITRVSPMTIHMNTFLGIMINHLGMHPIGTCSVCGQMILGLM